MFNANAPSYGGTQVSLLYRCFEREKQLKYEQRSHYENKMGSFTLLMLINFNNAHLKVITINIIAVICWPPPLISQLFFTQVFKAASFFTVWLFLCGL